MIRMVIQVFCLSAAAAVCRNKYTLVTFNTGLVHAVPKAQVRLVHIIERLKKIDADVVCLQEAFQGNDVVKIIEEVKSVYPHSFSMIHDYQTENFNFNSTPCSPSLLPTFSCLYTTCSMTNSLPEVIQCGIQNCDVWNQLNQECLTCIVESGLSKIGQCLTTTTKMNIPGLLLLSKKNLKNSQEIRFIPDRKQILPRSMLVSEVAGLGNVACTHLTANLGPVFYEPELQDLFSNWANENLNEARFIVNYLKIMSDVIVLGDLNIAPAIQRKKLTDEFEDTYKFFIRNRYVSPYVTRTGKATYTRENSFVNDKSYNAILDHIMYRKEEFKTVSTERIFDDYVTEIDGNLSDHFGVKVTLKKRKKYRRY